MTMENQPQQQYLPDEISIHIISRLPNDSITQCKLVCKGWLSIIKEDPVFHDMHQRRLLDDSTASSSLGFVVLERVRHFFSIAHYVRFAEYKHTEHDDDSEVMMRYNQRWKLPFKDHSPRVHYNLAIVGSCNGLVCISTTREYKPNHHTFVCNPGTGEVLNLSDSITNDHELESSSLILVGIGFGYLPSTNEYKVVRICGGPDIKNIEERRIKHVQVYTVGSGERRWRTIVPRISWSDISFSSSTRNEDPVFKLGVALNGALYFNNYRNIVSFDLANEEFRTIVPPPAPDTDIDGLGVLRGSLCATKSRRLVNPRSTMINTDLWVMEKDDINKDQEAESWIKKFSLPPQSYPMMFSGYGYIPLGALASPPRILLQPKWKKRIVSYNPDTDDSYRMDIPGDWRTNNSPIPYVKSCVSLKALRENTAKKGNLKCC